MVKTNCQQESSEITGKNHSIGHEMCDSDLLLKNLKWLTTEEAANYLRKSANAIRIMVHKKILKARKFRRRLYFRRDELDAVIESSILQRGY